MYLWDTLQVSDCCDDFYWGFDALKKNIFIGDVYVAVALRGLKRRSYEIEITIEVWY
jgi:hypothetical protein